MEASHILTDATLSRRLLSFVMITITAAALSSCTSRQRAGIITVPAPSSLTVSTSAGGTPVPDRAADDHDPINDSQDANLGNADVLFVRAVLEEDGTWTFSVTVQHPDTGWEDYADGWNVVLPNGTSVKISQESNFTRPLLHPHVNEQPFTRSQSGLSIPAGIDRVKVQAHDLLDGFGGREVWVDLTMSSGEGYEVIRQGEK